MIDFSVFLRREPVQLGDGSTVRALDAADEAAAAALYDSLPEGPLRAQGAEGDFQVSVYGQNERGIELVDGTTVCPEGFTSQYGAIGDAKFVDATRSW
jgi:hypothetical protein